LIGNMNFRLLFGLVFVVLLLDEFHCLENPYKILGIDKKASLQDIKRAYKQLAKEW